MISFNPGPSPLSKELQEEMCRLARSGFLSISHRSKAFIEVSKNAIEGLRKQTGIPSDYTIFYQPSATAAMDTTLRNLVHKKSFHFVHGAFSERFYHSAKELGIQASVLETPWDEIPRWRECSITKDIEMICITHNETSTGLMWPLEEIRAVRKAYPETLLTIDATSSFGGLDLDVSIADIWLFSVQKCLGLPAGLGFIVLSPRCMEIAKHAKGIASWQKFADMKEKMDSYQTVETPNVLAIALLAFQMKHWDIKASESCLNEHATLLYEAPLPWHPYIADPKWQSPTTLNFRVDFPQKWHALAEKENMVLGKGYGKLKDYTLRMANFPSIGNKSITHFIKHFQTHQQELLG